MTNQPADGERLGIKPKTTQHLCKICAVAINLSHRDRIGGTLEGYATCDDCGVEGPLNEYPIKKGGLSREWLLKMAAAEDAAGSVSVGGLAHYLRTFAKIEHRIVERIERDILGRIGLSEDWQTMPEGTRFGICETWRSIIREELERKYSTP